MLWASLDGIHRAICIAAGGATRVSQLDSDIKRPTFMAAMLIACGRDVACVLEGRWLRLAAKYEAEAATLALSSIIPCMPIRTVGVGTANIIPRKGLEMNDCLGAGQEDTLAETIAAFSLAPDLTTISALANDTFSQCHERLRGRADFD